MATAIVYRRLQSSVVLFCLGHPARVVGVIGPGDEGRGPRGERERVMSTNKSLTYVHGMDSGMVSRSGRRDFGMGLEDCLFLGETQLRNAECNDSQCGSKNRICGPPVLPERRRYRDAPIRTYMYLIGAPSGRGELVNPVGPRGPLFLFPQCPIVFLTYCCYVEHCGVSEHDTQQTYVPIQNRGTTYGYTE